MQSRIHTHMGEGWLRVFRRRHASVQQLMIKDWMVMEVDSLSEHNYINYLVDTRVILPHFLSD